MLVEVEAKRAAPRQDLEPLGADDPMFGRFQGRATPRGRSEHHGGVLGQDTYVVEHGWAGGLRVWRRRATTLQYVEERLRETGMRLLTCDEWEYACGAGATTLFRWGNDTPVDFYPTDTSAEDRDLKRAWVLSGGKLKYETPPAQWDLHRRLNLFGLRIANDPYKMDLVADGPRALGGDGGAAAQRERDGEALGLSLIHI